MNNTFQISQSLESRRNILMRAYEMLKVGHVGAETILNDLAGLQFLTFTAELAKSLTDDEAKILNGLAQKSDEEKRAVMEQIAKAHGADAEFTVRAQAASKKVLDEHIAYLKTRGDAAQKEAIAKILVEIG